MKISHMHFSPAVLILEPDFSRSFLMNMYHKKAVFDISLSCFVAAFALSNCQWDCSYIKLVHEDDISFFHTKSS